MLSLSQIQAATIVMALLPEKLDLLEFGQSVELQDNIVDADGDYLGVTPRDNAEPRTGHCSMHNVYEWWADGDQLECI